jgi:hypothetical protein
MKRVSCSMSTGTPIGGAFPLPFRASATVFRLIRASGIGGITIVDIAWTNMRRVITTAVVIGIIIGDIRDYRQVKPMAVSAISDLYHIIAGDFAGMQKGLPGRRGIGRRGKAP